MSTTEKERNYEKWFAAMESGEFKQGRGKMCFVDWYRETRHCCLGVLEVAVYGDSFTTTDSVSPSGESVLLSDLIPGITLSDSMGNTTYPSRGRLAEMGLHLEVKQGDWEGLREFLGESPFSKYQGRFGVSRYDVLMEINDVSNSYEPVMNAIRALGWHKETSREAA